LTQAAEAKRKADEEARRQAELAAAKQTQVTPTGKMTFTVLGAVAEPERSLIVARGWQSPF